MCLWVLYRHSKRLLRHSSGLWRLKRGLRHRRTATSEISCRLSERPLPLRQENHCAPVYSGLLPAAGTVNRVAIFRLREFASQKSPTTNNAHGALKTFSDYLDDNLWYRSLYIFFFSFEKGFCIIDYHLDNRSFEYCDITALDISLSLSNCTRGTEGDGSTQMYLLSSYLIIASSQYHAKEGICSFLCWESCEEIRILECHWPAPAPSLSLAPAPSFFPFALLRPPSCSWRVFCRFLRSNRRDW